MNRQILKIFVMTGLALALAAGAAGQTYASGSTGSDGAYAPTGTGVIYFNPAALGLDPSGDNVFNFTTINIPAGLTVKLIASNVRNQAVTWLATGDVTIAGILDLSGASANTLDASNANSVALYRYETEPGPGGYAGGVGSQGGAAPEAGLGAGGGPAGQNTGSVITCDGGSGSSYNVGYNFAAYTAGTGTPAGATYGTPYLIPLYGGSGGGGGWGSSASGLGGIGGAGGGAIRIVSTTQISVTGTITVNGGASASVSNQTGACFGGPGAGGAIHLIAPTIAGSGALTAESGAGFDGINGPANEVTSTGFVRFNTTANSFTGTVDGTAAATAFNGTVYAASGPLYNVPANSTLGLPSLTITQVGGVTVPANPSGTPGLPDVQINSVAAVTLNIAATNIPTGTVVTLRVTSDTAPDAVVTCAPLSGTAASSTATCSATFPYAVSIASLRASW